MKNATGRVRWFGVFFTALVLAGCGGDDGAKTDAQQSGLRLDQLTAGPTPFIASVNVEVVDTSQLSGVSFEIEPKPGAATKATHVTFSLSYLRTRGYVGADNKSVKLPLFGLYAGRENHIDVGVTFVDGSTMSVPLAYTPPAYVDPNASYDRALIVTARPSSASIGFDYFFMKSAYGTPVVVDTDGETRWVGNGVVSSMSSILVANGFIVSGPGLALHRVDLDGSVSTLPSIQSTTYTDLSHNIDPGKSGILVEPDRMVEGVLHFEDTVAEIDSSGTVLAQWDFEQILTQQMLQGGDDPTVLVRPGQDWFHVNASYYDPRDDTIVASSRENFVIKVDYQTGAIRWIFGDLTKYWYSVPSLRAKALILANDGLYPDGQHSVNIAPTGDLLLFDNGQPSAIPPAGFSAGQQRSFSTVASYGIDPSAQTATQHWSFDHGQTIKSPFCSSAQQTPDGSVLILYATADNLTHARMVGLDSNRNLVFDFQYNGGCMAAFNAQVIRFESLNFN